MNYNEIDTIAEDYNRLKCILRMNYIFKNAGISRSTGYNISNAVFKVNAETVENLGKTIDNAISELLDLRERFDTHTNGEK